MARRSLRLRIWVLMALVVAAAIGLSGWRLARLRQGYQRRAAYDSQTAQNYEELINVKTMIADEMEESLKILRLTKAGEQASKDSLEAKIEHLSEFADDEAARGRLRAEWTAERDRQAAEIARLDREIDAMSRRLRLAKLESHESDKERELVRYHTALAQKYERAARRPWLSVSPVPPEPK